MFNFRHVPPSSLSSGSVADENSPVGHTPPEPNDPNDWLSVIRDRVDEEQELITEIYKLRRARERKVGLVRTNTEKHYAKQTELTATLLTGPALTKLKTEVQKYRANIIMYNEAIVEIDSELNKLNIGDTLVANALRTLELFNVSGDLNTLVNKLNEMEL